MRDELLAPFPRTEESVRLHRQEYYAILSHVDQQIGRILDALESSGQSGNTLVTQDSRARYRILSRDVLAMTDHSTFLSNKVQFLLDATLGMVSIDQNSVVKIFSVVTVFLLPPSFIAGFFGMNFERLPLLHDSRGVTISVVLMVASAVLPYLWFRHRRWL